MVQEFDFNMMKIRGVIKSVKKISRGLDVVRME